MATVISELTMSLDGFVADPNDDVGSLFDWYGNGAVEVPTRMPERFTFRTSEASARYLREAIERIGALVSGRRLVEVGRWHEMGGHPFKVPVFVVTHHPPTDWDPDLPFTYVTDGVERAVEQASAVAGDGWVGVGGPNVAMQCLNADLLDEVRINLVPVLFGEGIHFGGVSNTPVPLENPEVIEGDRVTHLIYRVRRA